MSRYRKIDTKIWTDEKFRKLTNDSKYFFVYLLTSPHSTPWGAYVLDDLYIQADLGYTPAKIKTCWEEIIKSKMVLRCSETRLICFPNWFKYNLPVNQKSLIACIRGILDMPKSTVLSRFCRESTWVSEQLANLNLSCSEQLDDEQEQEQEQEQDKTSSSSGDDGCGYSESFLTFWKSYPRKIGKGAAWKAWKKSNGKPSMELIIKSIQDHMKTDQWSKDNGQFIPHPQTYINQRRWEDETEGGQDDAYARLREKYKDAK